jgi:hypothetical protein
MCNKFNNPFQIQTTYKLVPGRDGTRTGQFKGQSLPPKGVPEGSFISLLCFAIIIMYCFIIIHLLRRFN